jgi:hypothetical protein
VGVLAGLNCLREVEVAGVILAIREEQDEVARRCLVRSGELVMAGLVYGVIESGSGTCALFVCGWIAQAQLQGLRVVSPGLNQFCDAAEVGDESLVAALP